MTTDVPVDLQAGGAVARAGGGAAHLPGRDASDADELVTFEFARRLGRAEDAGEVARATVRVVRGFGLERVAVAVQAGGSTVVQALEGWQAESAGLQEARWRADRIGPTETIWTRIGALGAATDDGTAEVPLTVRPLQAGGVALGLLILGAPDRSLLDLPIMQRRLDRVARAASAALLRLAGPGVERGRTGRDPLTGVLSRAGFEGYLTRTLAGAGAAASGRFVGVVSCDIDRFRRVNDALGHTAGDELLRVVAGRLADAAGADGHVARVGSDEFLVAFRDLPAEDEIDRRQESLDAALRPPMEVDGRLLYLSASFGRAVEAGGTTGPAFRRSADLVRLAETDTRAAKDRRRSRPLQGGSLDLLELDADLHGAVDRGELVAYFQPLYDVPTGRLVAFEALARWPHPRLGFIPPDVFIALAEENGLIHAIGEQMLAQGRRFLAAQADPTTKLNVNVSIHEVSVPGFAQRVAAIFDGDEQALRRVTVELTESALILDHELVAGELRALRNLGVGVALDDFGSGYSSLSQLQEVPATELKVDKRFVACVGTASRSMLTAITQLAVGLGLVVVAEGVERADQLQMLRELQCHRVQGYLLSPALPAHLALALPRTIDDALS